MDFILAQVFGGIALILVSIGYFLKSKFKFLIIQVIANFFYASAFFVVGAYTGALIVTISIFRCLYIFFAEKHSFKYLYHFLSIFIALYIISTILLWSTPLDLMPLFTSIMFTIGYTIKNLQVMRYMLILPNAILVIYNILSTTYVSAILDALEVVVIIVAIIKFNLAKQTGKTNCLITKQ